MARAAVKAKQQAAAAKKKPAPQPARAKRARRGHAGGGNPNQDLFFMRLRRRAKPVYLLLAVLFAVTFAFLGVGSGTNSGLDQLFSNLGIHWFRGDPVKDAQDAVKKHPNQAKGYRDLADAYIAKGDTDGAITALQSYTRIREKDAAAWTKLAGLQMTQATDLQAQWQNAYAIRQLSAPSQPFLPGGKLGQVLGENKIEQAAAQNAEKAVQDLGQRTQLAFNNGVSSYDQAAQLQPSNSTAWFSLATAAQQAGDSATALRAYKRYLKLNPDSTSAPQIKALIKQLQGTGSG